MATRAELVEATRSRYVVAPKVQKQRILDEFVAVTGYHRKHAMRLLRAAIVKKVTDGSIKKLGVMLPGVGPSTAESHWPMYHRGYGRGAARAGARLGASTASAAFWQSAWRRPG